MTEGEKTMNPHDRGQLVSTAAEVYDEFFVPALFEPWPDVVLAAADVQSGHQVLDVACGTGVLTRAAAARVGDHGEAVGVDINPDMIAVAERKAPNLVWQISPAESLAFSTEQFDRVVSQFGLMFFDDPVAALGEMNRVLRPDGVMSIAVWGELHATPGYAAMAALLEELFGAEIAQSIKAPYALGDIEKLEALLRNASITTFHIDTVIGQARFASLDDWLYTDIRGWTLADAIDEHQFASLRQHALVRLAPFVGPGGEIEFNAPAHVVTAAR
jgi:ubiquinone/menaquinone biosynthesis C-methylase UbiE